MNFAKRVQRGIKVLDQKYPDWRNSIVLDELELSHAKYCIIGQVAYHRGYNYDEVMERLAGTDSDVIEFAYEHGFDSEFSDQYEKLQEEWVRALKDE